MLKLQIFNSCCRLSFRPLVLIAFNILLCCRPCQLYVTADSDQCKTAVMLPAAAYSYPASGQCGIAKLNGPNNKMPKGHTHVQQQISLPLLQVNIATSIYDNATHAIATRINKLPPPNQYEMHTPFINFTSYGYPIPMPIYINMVRDPVERVISRFYYIRRASSWKKRGPKPTTDWLNRDFETCVLEGDAECTFITGEIHDFKSQALYYCGHNPKCFKFSDEWAIQTAKENIERYYSVVGVLEEMNLTLAVLEKYIPRFFANATRVYAENEQELKYGNRSFNKPEISEKIKNMLRQNFTREIEFYEFCKQRLHKQYKAAVLLNIEDL